MVLIESDGIFHGNEVVEFKLVNQGCESSYGLEILGYVNMFSDTSGYTKGGITVKNGEDMNSCLYLNGTKI